VGIYDPQNGERLPVQDKGRALSVISDALIMQEVTLP
jgi:hypothetical protein